VAIGGDLLYVADLQSRRVSVWDKKRREYLRGIPAEGESSPEARLFSPANLALDREGNLYVSDLGAFRVQKYDPAGRYLRSFGTLGSGPGQLVRPKGIDLDQEGRLYVVDAATELVQIFDPQGNLLLFFGEPREDGSGLSLPAKVRVSRELVPRFQHLAAPTFALEYLILVSSQYGDHKLSVFGFGRRSP
jgi:sugar lactone lactonase YvrE